MGVFGFLCSYRRRRSTHNLLFLEQFCRVYLYLVTPLRPNEIISGVIHPSFLLFWVASSYIGLNCV
jgi:hypothetical protein